MDWITDKIAIGNYLQARDAELLRREAVRLVLGLDGTLKGVDPSELGLQRIECIPLWDVSWGLTLSPAALDSACASGV